LKAAAEPALVEAARSEGSVIWQDGLAEAEAKSFIDAFQARYPFIKVQHSRITGTDSRERLLRELSSGTVNVDVFDVSGEEVPTFKQADILASYDWTSLVDGIRPEQLDPDQMLLATLGSVHGIGYNRNLVAAADLPKTWDDLLDPRWQGKLVVDSRPLTYVGLVPAWGEQKVLDFVGKLAAQKPQIRRGQSDSINLMGAGDFPLIAGTYNHSLQLIKDHGAPVDITFPEPVPITLDLFAVAAKAPHPNAARLLVGFMASEGNRYLDDTTHRGIPLPGYDTRPAQLIAGKQLSEFTGRWVDQQAELTTKVQSALGIQ
jgi:iron(III) transport system substrate-binding protein